MYPDQGRTVNVFSMFPGLYSAGNEFRRFYSVGYISKLYTLSYTAYVSSILFVYRVSIHNVPLVFPYDRIDIKAYGPFPSLIEYLKLTLFLSGYVLFSKHSAAERQLKPYVTFDK